MGVDVVLRHVLSKLLTLMMSEHTERLRGAQIFQLIIPEFDEKSQAPLAVLVLLCIVAPFWAWGASLMSTPHPERKNTLARCDV